MSIVLDAIAEEIALLERTVPVAVAPFGYGLDSDGVLDLTPTCADIDPSTPKAIVQALMRRLQTPRGTLPDDLEYGLDVRDYLNRALPLGGLRDEAGEVRSECSKDDRVEDARVTATLVSMKELNIAIEITPADSRTGGPFSFTLAVAPGAVMLEAFNAQP